MVRQGIIACAALLLWGCAGVGVGRSDLSLDGWDSFEAGRYEEAAADFIVFLAEHPNHPRAEDAMFLIGESYMRVDADSLAKPAFEEYLRRYPQGRYAQLARRRLDAIEKAQAAREELYAREHKKWAVAIAGYKKALEAEPDDAELWVGLGNVYWQKGSVEEALDAYERALELNPSLEADRSFAVRLEEARRSLAARASAAQDPFVIVADSLLYADYFREAVLSGEVLNAGAGVASDVVVEATAYDAQLRPLAVRSAYVGLLRPGQKRAFSVKLGRIPLDRVHEVRADVSYGTAASAGGR